MDITLASSRPSLLLSPLWLHLIYLLINSVLHFSYWPKPIKKKRVRVVTCIRIYMAIVNYQVTLLRWVSRPHLSYGIIILALKQNPISRLEGAKMKNLLGPERLKSQFLAKLGILSTGWKRLLCKRASYLVYTPTVRIFTGTANPRSWVSMQK